MVPDLLCDLLCSIYITAPQDHGGTQSCQRKSCFSALVTHEVMEAYWTAAHSGRGVVEKCASPAYAASSAGHQHRFVPQVLRHYSCIPSRCGDVIGAA